MVGSLQFPPISTVPPEHIDTVILLDSESGKERRKRKRKKKEEEKKEEETDIPKWVASMRATHEGTNRWWVSRKRRVKISQNKLYYIRPRFILDSKRIM